MILRNRGGVTRRRKGRGLGLGVSTQERSPNKAKRFLAEWYQWQGWRTRSAIVCCLAVAGRPVEMMCGVGNGVPVNRASVARKGQNTGFWSTYWIFPERQDFFGGSVAHRFQEESEPVILNYFLWHFIDG